MIRSPQVSVQLTGFKSYKFISVVGGIPDLSALNLDLSEYVITIISRKFYSSVFQKPFSQIRREKYQWAVMYSAGAFSTDANYFGKLNFAVEFGAVRHGIGFRTSFYDFHFAINLGQIKRKSLFQ